MYAKLDTLILISFLIQEFPIQYTKVKHTHTQKKAELKQI